MSVRLSDVSADARSDLQHALALPNGTGLFEMSSGLMEGGSPAPAFDVTGLPAAREVRRREFHAGRHCAVRALRLAGCHASSRSLDLPMDTDRLPIWPSGWIGSISHTSQGAVAVAASSSTCAALGIDMELWVNDATANEILHHIALPGELEALPIHPLPRAVTLLFSAKEALYKALYPQVRTFFDFTAARLVAVSASRLDFELCQTWGPGWQQGRVLSVTYAFSRKHVYTALHVPADESHTA